MLKKGTIQTIIRHGFIEMLLLMYMILYQSGRMDILRALYLPIPLYFCSIKPKLSNFNFVMAMTILVVLFGVPMVHFYVLYFSLSVNFPQQNFFEKALFSLLFVKSSNLLGNTPLVNYLNWSLQLTLLTTAAVDSVQHYLKIKSSILNRFNVTILINLILAFIAIVPLNLHLEIINSPYCFTVFTAGITTFLVLVVVSIIISVVKSVPNIIKRKLFHIPPLLLFPYLNQQARPLFLVALVGTFYTLFIIQILRYFSKTDGSPTPKILRVVWNWMADFVDKRDQFLWVTHLSLFAGTASTYFFRSNPIVQNSSVALAIGDAFAAIVGTRYGKIKIGSKSLEGFVAFIVGTLLTLLAVSAVLSVQLAALKLIMIVPVVALVELLSKQIDNLYLPMLFIQLYVLADMIRLY